MQKSIGQPIKQNTNMPLSEILASQSNLKIIHQIQPYHQANTYKENKSDKEGFESARNINFS